MNIVTLAQFYFSFELEQDKRNFGKYLSDFGFNIPPILQNNPDDHEVYSALYNALKAKK